MKTRSFVIILLTAAAAAGATIAGCSGSNNPSTTAAQNSGASSSASGTTTGAGTSAATGASGSSASATTGSSATGSDAGADAEIPACPANLLDKITTCTATDVQECVKGCGPNLPPDASQPNLGTKTCTCTTGVYQCVDCTYISPLPACYVESADPPECEAGVTDEAPCSTPCPPSTGNDVCTTVSDAGKSEGCVCVAQSQGNMWTCATLPW